MAFLFGKKQRANPALPLNLVNERTPSNDAGHPVPVIYGNHKISERYIVDLFDVQPVPLYTSVSGASIGPFNKGGRRVVTGYEYYASYAAALCLGPIDALTKILVSNEIIWQGRLTPASADAGGMTPIATAYGTLRFYWGLPAQQPDAVLRTVYPAPAWPHLCYFVAVHYSFGRSPEPPALDFYVTRRADPVLGFDVPLTDAVYDILTNKIYGAGLSENQLDTASFTAGKARLAQEGFAFSPALTESQNLRQLLAEWLQYVNAALHYHDGKISLILARPGDGDPVVTLTEADLLEEPKIHSGSWADSWNETRVTFRNSARDFESDVATHSDAANYAIVGHYQQKEFNRQHVTRPEVAAGLAQALGQSGGAPPGTVSLVVKSRLTPFCVPGYIVELHYPSLGLDSLLLRVKEADIGAPHEPKVTLECEIVLTSPVRFTAPPVDQAVPIEYPAPVAPLARLALLPPDLLGQSADGLLLAVARPIPQVVSYQAFFSWDENVEWLPLTGGFAFPVAVTLNRWQSSGASLLFDLTAATEADSARIAAYAANPLNLHLVVLPFRDHGASGELASSWNAVPYSGAFTLVGLHRWEIEVTPGTFNSLPLSAGVYPSSLAFLGYLSDFNLFTTNALYLARAGANHPQDTAQQRLFRIATATGREAQSLDQALELTFQRQNPTQNPGGTLSADWGLALAPTAW